MPILPSGPDDHSSAPLALDHSMTAPSQPPPASTAPSGLKATFTMVRVDTSAIRRRVRPRASQIHTSPRLLHAAQYCPLLLIATATIISKASVKALSLIVAPARLASCIS